MTNGDKQGVRCVDCDKFSLQKRRDMSIHGFGVCQASKETAEYRSATYRHDCGVFVQAKDGAAAKRLEWINSKGAVNVGND